MPNDRAQILISAVDQTRQAFASVKGNLEGLSSAASKVNGLLAGLGAALSVAGLIAAGKHALDTADNLAKRELNGFLNQWLDTHAGSHWR